MELDAKHDCMRDTSFVCGQMVDISLSRITELFFN